MALRNLSDDMPSVVFNFQASKYLDPRITFTRASYAPASDPASGTGNVDGGVQEFNVNVPRLTDQGLLVEEGRSNAITYSTAPDAEFVQDSAHFDYTFNQPAPDGTNTAHKITNSSNTTSNRGGQFSAFATIPTSGKIAVSVFVKPVGGQVIYLGGESGNQGYYGPPLTYFDFILSPPTANKTASNGTPAASNLVVEPFIEDVGGGWYRLINIVDLDSTDSFKTGVTRGPRVAPVTTGTSVFVWGYQIETGASATSYIPTSGATVIRAPDLCEITGTNFSSWYNNGTEGTIVTTASSGNAGTSDNLFIVYLGGGASSGNNRICSTVGSEFTAFAQDTTLDIRFADAVYKSNVAGKGAFGYKPKDSAFYVDGAAVTASDNGDSIPTTAVNRMYIGMNRNEGNQLNGYISNIAYYPTRLTDTVLGGLTQ